ncbi:MAG: methyltransferase domain-containing protein [Desulfobacteraceae bacterium]|jgi:SAM-dependent methyltransferase
MNPDRARWNAKHRRKTGESAPAAVVRRFWRHAPGGRALDIAAGAGRNARYLAARGFRVDAVDISDVALGGIPDRPPNLRPVCADLACFDIPPATYSLIVNVRFLKRRLFPQIIAGLVPGGLLIFESYLAGSGPGYCAPSCRDYLLGPNELLHAFLPLHIRYYREALLTEGGRPFFAATLVAVRESLIPP